MEEPSTKKTEKQERPLPISPTNCFLIEVFRAAFLKCLGIGKTHQVPEDAKPSSLLPCPTNTATSTSAAENDLSPGGDSAANIPVTATADPAATEPEVSSTTNTGASATDPQVADPPSDASGDPPASTVSLLSVPSGSSVSTGNGTQHN